VPDCFKTSPCAKLSSQNEFDLHENEPAGVTHSIDWFDMKTCSDTEAKGT